MRPFLSIFALSIAAGWGQAYGLEIHVRKVPSVKATSLNILTRQQIQDGHYPDVAQVLNAIPGVTANTSNGLGQLTVRGHRPGHVVTMVDGVPLMDVTHVRNEIHNGQLDVQTIEKLSVIKGVASHLIPMAMGGVLEIDSVKGNGPLSFETDLSISSQRSKKLALAIQEAKNQSTYYVAASGTQHRPSSFKNKRHGTRVSQRQDETKSFGLITYQPNDQYDLMIKYQTIEGAERLNPYNLQMLPEVSDDENAYHHQLIQLNQHVRTFQKRLNHNVRLAYQTSDNRYDTSWSNQGHLQSQMTYATYEAQWHVQEKWLVSIDAANLHQRAIFHNRIKPHTHQTFIGFKNTWGHAERNHLTLKVHKVVFNAQQPLNMQALAALQVTDRLKLTAGIGNNSRVASLCQQFGNPAYGIKANPNLKSERMQSYEIGLQQQVIPQRFNINLSLFFSRLKNLIDYHPGQQRYVNGSHRHIRGGEIEVQSTPPVSKGSLQIAVAYTYLKAVDYPGSQPAYLIPMHQWGNKIQWIINEAYTLFNDITLQSRQIDWVKGHYQRQPTTTTWRMGGQWRLNHHVQVYAHIENVLNQRREYSYGYGRAPLTVYLGIRSCF